jgi:hypothetical protein
MSDQKWTGPRFATRADLEAEGQEKPESSAFKQRDRRIRHMNKVGMIGMQADFCANLFGCKNCKAKSDRLKEYVEAKIGEKMSSQDFPRKYQLYIRGFGVVNGGAQS